MNAMGIEKENGISWFSLASCGRVANWGNGEREKWDSGSTIISEQWLNLIFHTKAAIDGEESAV